MAEVEDHVIPVRLDLEHDHFRLKDTFLWNVSDKVVTPEIFAQGLCDDFKVPVQHFASKIVAAIQERVKEYQDQVMPMLTHSPDGEVLRGKLDPDGEGEAKALYEVFRRAREGSEEIRTDGGEEDTRVKVAGEDEEGVLTVEEAMEALPVLPEEDLRILIKVRHTFSRLVCGLTDGAG
jgi:SWI/SNF-related matrix-associated actin-dependent regulator of chromatin subfamily B protein 1